MTDCPVCAAKEAAGDSQAAMAPVAPVAMPASAPIVPMPRPAAYPQAQPKAGLPSWLVAVGVAALLVLVLAGGYLVLLPKMRNGQAAATPQAAPAITMESPQAAQPAAAPPASSGSRLGKYIEVVGIRIVEENKRTMVKFLIVNHAAAELADVNGMVEIHPSKGGAMVGRVEVKIPSMEPYESREFNASLNTNLRAYEIPDWQFLRGQFVE
ncbi:MAG: hypothetical protein J0L64_06205 [Acidobacteria bacterium]|nr:hypothetical protein [Acidobacteriota bacterium]